MESLLHDDDVRSGDATDTTLVPAQKVHNFIYDRWIALKCCEEFPVVVFHGVAWTRYSTTTTYVRAMPLTRPEYRFKRSITLDPTFGSRSNLSRSFHRLFSME
ncbi:hypothetical protein D5086_031839 [Populus alba]|uniref:Uncharacterized protein n=1 Tax=Populus alba TaxID=43335 RepID=A0ACC4AJP3_POPAL